MQPLIALSLVAALGAPASAATREDVISLEVLLERYQEEQQRVLEAYRGQVNALVTDIEAALAGGTNQKLADLRDALVGLGAPVAPLLVNLIDAGPAADSKQLARARQVATALARIPTRAITGELLAMLDTGTLEGRRNALRVLAQSEETARVGAVLRARFAESEGEERPRLLATLATLGGPSQAAFLEEVLGDEDPEMVGMAIGALTEARAASAAPRILALVSDPELAGRHASELAAYYRALPEVMDSDHSEALVALAEASRNDPDRAVELLELLGDFHDAWSLSVKRSLRDLTEESTPRITEAALVALARDGDRSAKRTLLEPLNDRIDRNDGVASSWRARGELHYRIGDYRDAIKDYTESMRLEESWGRKSAETYIGLARCNALLGRKKEAAAWLDEAPISISQLRALASDPDFAEVVADERYREVFQLPEGELPGDE